MVFAKYAPDPRSFISRNSRESMNRQIRHIKVAKTGHYKALFIPKEKPFYFYAKGSGSLSGT